MQKNRASRRVFKGLGVPYVRYEAVCRTQRPYKGLGPALADLVTGRIHIIFSDMAGLLPLCNPGELRALGVTSAQRFSDLPDLPTLAEAGVPGYEATSWYGFLGPAGLPPDVVAKLNRELINIVQNPAMKGKFASLGIEPVTGTPDEFGAYIRSEMAKWRAITYVRGNCHLRPDIRAELVGRAGHRLDPHDANFPFMAGFCTMLINSRLSFATTSGGSPAGPRNPYHEVAS